LTDRQFLRATLLSDPQPGLRLHSTALLSAKSNTFPIAHINGGEGQYLRDLDHIADEDATVIFVGTATDDPRTIKQAWNARLPKMTRIVGGV
jgi:predicted dienelactone hydrolase